jgi:hypothetical protein
VEHPSDAFKITSRSESALRESRIRAHVHPKKADIWLALAVSSIDLRFGHCNPRFSLANIWP